MLGGVALEIAFPQYRGRRGIAEAALDEELLFK
jgi:hypothetical protein